MKKAASWWRGTERPALADWLLAGAILALGYFVFLYTDILITLEDSVQFWDAGLRGFYQYNLEHGTHFSYPPVYEVPIYFVFALWNFPLWLLHRFSGLDYIQSAPALLYAKSMLVVFTLACALLVYRIARTGGLAAGRAKWAAFAFLTAHMLVVPILVTAQYDVVELLFMLLGVHAYVQKKDLRFTLWFMLASTIKTFALLAYIPLVLLREKRLLHAAGRIAAGFAGLVLCKLIYWGDAAYHASTSARSSQVFGWLLRGTVAVGLGPVALFAAGFGALCVWCYVKKPPGESLHRYAVYIPMAAYMLLFGLCYTNPYWVVLYVPFIVLAAFFTPHRLKIALLLDALGAAALQLVFVARFHDVYKVEGMRTLLLPHFFPQLTNPRFTYLTQAMPAGFGEWVPAFMAVLLCCHGALLVLLYPARGPQPKEAKEEAPLQRSVLWARAAVPCVFMAAMLGIFFTQANRIILNTETVLAGASAQNLMLPGVEIAQPLRFEEDLRLTAIGVMYEDVVDTWETADYVRLRLVDAETGAELYQGYKAANELTPDYWSHYDLPGVRVQAGREYTVLLSGFSHKTEQMRVRLADYGLLHGGPEDIGVALVVQAK